MPRSPRDAAVAYAEALRTGDFDGLVALHHPEAVSTLLGTTLVSGRYRGRDAFFAHTFRHVLANLAETDEVYLKGYRVACSDHEHAVLLLHGGLPTKAGGRYDQNYLQLFRVVDGLIVETHELLDTFMLETEVLGREAAVVRTYPAERLRPSLRGGDVSPGLDAAQIAAAWMAALQAGDWPAMRATLADDAVLQIAGASPIAGAIHGREAITTHIGGHMARLRPGSLRLDGPARLACLDEGGFCILANLVAEFPDRASWRQTVGIVATPSGALIGEVQLYFDTAAEERQMFDNPLSGEDRIGADESFSITSVTGRHTPWQAAASS